MKNLKLISKSFSVLAACIAMAACSSSPVETKVQADAEQQKDIHTTAQAATTGRLEIMTSSKLTNEQKEKFMNLMGETQKKTLTLREQSAKLKAALFEQLTQGKYDHKEVSVYKSKIQKIESEKMDLMFASLDEVRKILGVSLRDPEVMQFYRERMEW